MRTNKRLVLASKKGLRPIKSLTATEEKISFDESEIPKSRKRRQIKLHPLRFFHAIALELELFMRQTVNGLKNIFTNVKKKLVFTIEIKAAAQERKTVNPLPVAFGALCGCATVATLTLGIMALSLFAPYAVKHETVTIPDLEGKTFADLEPALEKINLTVEYENNPDVADGQIFSQSAPAGATRRVDPQSGYFDLRVTVCKKEPVTVPTSIVGSSQRDAELALKNSGIAYTVVEEYSASVPKGSIINIYPGEGNPVDKSTRVKLTVSLGEKETTFIVPDLSGLAENEAISRIRLSGFTVGSIIYTPSEKPLGTVVSQSLRPHGYAPEKSVISIWVAAT